MTEHDEPGRSHDDDADADDMSSYLWDGTGPVDPDVARLEDALLPLRRPVDDVLPPWRPPRPWERAVPWVVGIAATVLVGVWLVPALLRGDGADSTAGPGWTVRPLVGDTTVRDAALEETGRLHAGNWLETGPVGQAEVRVADIGTLTVQPASRLRLLRTDTGEHRVELERGGLSALVVAPPRLFVVETPAATAVDLGCAYDLRVDEAGSGRLHVTAGRVELEGAGRRVHVPAGAVCLSRRGAGPGTPHWDDAPSEMVEALEALDFPEGPEAEGALDTVLAAARSRDSLTLWHLVPQVSAARRADVVRRLAQAAPPPGGVTAEGVAELDPDMLAAWWASLPFGWTFESGPRRRR